jgi:hypothetical protein
MTRGSNRPKGALPGSFVYSNTSCQEVREPKGRTVGIINGIELLRKPSEDIAYDLLSSESLSMGPATIRNFDYSLWFLTNLPFGLISNPDSFPFSLTNTS